MDVSFVTGKEKFNYRVCALLLHEGKILAMQDERSPYYYLPGAGCGWGDGGTGRGAGAAGGAGRGGGDPAAAVAEPGVLHRRCGRPLLP